MAHQSSLWLAHRPSTNRDQYPDDHMRKRDPESYEEGLGNELAAGWVRRLLQMLRLA